MKKNNPTHEEMIVSFANPYPDCTVKELLENHLLIPRKIRHLLRTKKHLLINNQIVNWQSLVKKGDLITLIFDQEDYPSKSIKMGNPDIIDCLYEDQHVIVVNKPEGMKSHGNQPDELGLLNHVSAYCGQTCYVIHRLDMETSGTIIFAKNPFILPIMNRLLEDKRIHRQYWALISGDLLKKTVTYREPIGRDRHDRRKRVVDLKNGQKAITMVKQLKAFKNQTSLVECQLKTGRTHQIRVHLSYHGHPLIGDPLYNVSRANRLMLHAHRLTFVHPLTLETISVEAISKSFEKELP